MIMVDEIDSHAAQIVRAIWASPWYRDAAFVDADRARAIDAAMHYGNITLALETDRQELLEKPPFCAACGGTLEPAEPRVHKSRKVQVPLLGVTRVVILLCMPCWNAMCEAHPHLRSRLTPAADRYCDLMAQLLADREVYGELGEQEESTRAAELDVYWRAMSADERAEIEQWLTERYRS
jgi:hypothetical protein